MYARPIDQWCLELLDNLPIISQFHWDAERHYKYNGMRWVRFIDEPWTADEWWEVQVFNLSICKYCVNTDTMMFATYQSALPVGAVPFCIVLYADKTRLSSFGTAKGYPVIARSANLPAEMRNSTGFGGGRLVGWLPIVRSDTKTIFDGSALLILLGSGRCRRNREKRFCQLQTYCLAWIILWNSAVNWTIFTSWAFIHLCRQHSAMDLFHNFDHICWLWRAVCSTLYSSMSISNGR